MTLIFVMEIRAVVIVTNVEWRKKKMCEIVREMTREELVTLNNELRAEIENLKAEFKEEQLKKELWHRDGMIAGLKFALRCNGVSGGEVER